MSKIHLTDTEYNSFIFKACIETGAVPSHVPLYLLDSQDKEDIRHRLIPYESLLCHIKAWMKAGCPDYAHGKSDPRYLKPLDISFNLI